MAGPGHRHRLPRGETRFDQQTRHEESVPIARQEEPGQSLNRWDRPGVRIGVGTRIWIFVG